MTRSVRTTAHLSISFTPEEVAVLAADLGYDPARTGITLPAEWTRREREVALGVARGSLRSRRVLVDGESGPAMAYAVAALFDIVCAPQVRVELYPGDGPPIRYLAQPDATVRVEERDGLYRFAPLATSDLIGWIAADAGIDAQPAGAGSVSELDGQAYLAARRLLAGAAGDRAADRAAADRTDGRQRLIEAGLPEVLVDALARPGSTRALALRRRADGLITGGEVAWVDAGEAGLWLLPDVDQPFAGPGEWDGEADDPVGQVRDTADSRVRIEPVSADALLAMIAAFTQDET